MFCESGRRMGRRGRREAAGTCCRGSCAAGAGNRATQHITVLVFDRGSKAGCPDAERGTSEYRSTGPFLHAIRRTERISTKAESRTFPACINSTRAACKPFPACLRRLQAVERHGAKQRASGAVRWRLRRGVKWSELKRTESGSYGRSSVRGGSLPVLAHGPSAGPDAHAGAS